jgi:hypothetical protein
MLAHVVQYVEISLILCVRTNLPQPIYIYIYSPSWDFAAAAGLSESIDPRRSRSQVELMACPENEKGALHVRV